MHCFPLDSPRPFSPSHLLLHLVPRIAALGGPRLALLLALGARGVDCACERAGGGETEEELMDEGDGVVPAELKPGKERQRETGRSKKEDEAGGRRGKQYVPSSRTIKASWTWNGASVSTSSGLAGKKEIQ